jgi:hypothetical protein
MNFGQNILEFVQTNVAPIFLVVLACVAIYYLVKREMTKFGAFILVAIVVAGFVFDSEGVKNILVNIFKFIFKT